MHRISFVTLAMLVAVVSASPAVAQTPAGDAWQVTFAPYFMGAAMSGTTAKGDLEVPVEMSASEIFDNLQFGAMGLLVARKGNWGLGGDAIWMSLGVTGETTGRVGVSGAVDMNQGAFAFYGLRRLGAAADVMVGARVNMLQGTIRTDGPLNDRSADADATWIDPLVGLLLRTPDNGGRWHAKVYTEIGGFGVGSTFTWQVFPTVGVDLGKGASLEFGYRWLDIDYESSDDRPFTYDVLTQGPVVGVAFKF
jgi:hypothetical protein